MQNLVKDLSIWKKQVFSAALLQRMLPNYRLFSDTTEFGDYNLIQNQLDIIWQKLSKAPIKFNLEVQLEKLEQAIPSADKFDMFAVYPAQDVCSGLICLFESFDDDKNNCAKELSLLSINTVESYLNFYALSNGLTLDIANEPLMLWEIETQQAIYKNLNEATENKATCQAIRKMVTENRLSSLGFEY